MIGIPHSRREGKSTLNRFRPPCTSGETAPLKWLRAATCLPCNRARIPILSAA